MRLTAAVTTPCRESKREGPGLGPGWGPANTRTFRWGKKYTRVTVFQVKGKEISQNRFKDLVFGSHWEGPDINVSQE